MIVVYRDQCTSFAGHGQQAVIYVVVVVVAIIVIIESSLFAQFQSNGCFGGLDRAVL